MARDLFRMPKGVPRDVARLLRTSGRKIPKAGQVLSYENAYKLADALTEYRRALVPVVRKATRAMDAARTTATREKWSKIAQAKITEAQKAEQGLNTLRGAEGIEPLPPIAPADVKPIVLTDEPGDDYFLPEEGAVEAFVGVDYTEAAGHEHAKGRASDVSFNAVLRWRDGRPITQSDARDALMQFANNGTLPRGIVCDAVSWSGWKGKPRHGTVDDLDHFRAVLQHVGDYGVRVGLVKPDRL